MLLKDLKIRGEERVAVDPDGTVAVEGEAIGTLDGFAFAADPSARAGEKRMLLAAAERHLPREFARRCAALVAAPDADFALAFDGVAPPRILWRGVRVGKLTAGRDALHPRVETDRALEVVPFADRRAVADRLAHGSPQRATPSSAPDARRRAWRSRGVAGGTRADCPAGRDDGLPCSAPMSTARSRR